MPPAARAADVEGAPPGLRLRVLSLNTHALPVGFAPRTRERLGLVARHLPRLRPDLAAFQECWTADSRRILLEAGAAAGLRFAWHRRRVFGGSGLLLLSRHPIEAVGFRRFRVPGPPERVDQGDFLGGKGFALARLGGPLRGLLVGVTHLQASYGGRGYLAHRTAQAAELGLALADLPDAVALAGDLNTEPAGLPVALLRGLARLRDAAEEAGRPEPTTQALRPDGSKPARRIDYVLVRGGAGLGLRVAGLRRVLELPEPLSGGGWMRPSDHAGLLAKLEVRPGTPDAEASPPAPPLAEAIRLLLEGARHDEARRRAGLAATGAGVALTGLAASGRAISRRVLLQGLLGAAAGGTVVAAGGTAEFAAEAAAFRDLAAQLVARLPPGSSPGAGSGILPSGDEPDRGAPPVPRGSRR